MSSSEDDTIVIPVKRIRRRNYASSNKSTFKQINLYSQKVLPALNKVNRTIPQQISEEYKPQVISKPNIDRTISVDEASSSDDEVQVVCEESPVKPLPVTPPPEGNTFTVLNDRKFQKRKLLLLKNVASVLQKAKQDNPSAASCNDNAVDDAVEIIEGNQFVVVKVRFQSTVYKYPLNKDSNFNEIFDRLAKEGNTSKKNLLLTLNDRQVVPEDTPAKIGLSVIDFLDAVVMDESMLQQAMQDVNNKQNFIKVHFQSKFFKQKQTYSINKFNPFGEIMKTYATLTGIVLEDLSFLFDGEVIDGSLTAVELDIEDDYCIDVAKTNKK